jgi:hypothetical protein
MTCDYAQRVATVASFHRIYSSAARQRGIRPHPVCTVICTLARVAPYRVAPHCVLQRDCRAPDKNAYV